MADLRDILPERLDGRLLWYGTVAKTCTDITQAIPVIIPEFDPMLEWGPCLWQSRDATSLPAKGDRCLVAFDNRRNPWVVAWWPF